MYNVHIFDEFVQFSFNDLKIHYNDEKYDYRRIEIEVHKNLEALNSAKCNPIEEEWKRVRMNVHSE